jgi:trk system potassium uptake protein TrkA
MNIVIVGAGGVGRYISSLLSKEEYNVILIDTDEKKLEIAAMTIDVATKKGSGTDWQLLDDLLELSPEFLIALTSNDEVNLVSCALAKHLGYPKTIARVKDNRFLNRIRLDFAQIFEVDQFIGPNVLVAHDVLKYLVLPGSLAVENFANGAVQLRTLQVPPQWKKDQIPLKELSLPKGVIVGLIRRDDALAKKVIFPHGDDVILRGDEVTFIGEAEPISQMHQFLGMKDKKIDSVVLVGGSMTAVNLAKLLEARGISVKIIEKVFEVCRWLAEELPNATIVNHDATDLEFLRGEKITSSDAFVCCTSDDDTNVLTALLAKELGCDEVSMILSNTSLVPMLAKQGIHYTVSPRIVTADHILSQVIGGKVTSLVSFYENIAEVMEVSVSPNSKVAGIPIAELGPLLPQDLLIVIIQNRGRIMVAHGDRVISPGDSVIVITHPKHVKELENIF